MPVFSPTVTEPAGDDPTTSAGSSHNSTVDLTPPSIDSVPSFASAALPAADPSGYGFNSALDFSDPTPGAVHREELRDESRYSPTPGDSNYLAIGNDIRPGYDETNLSDSFHAVNKGTALNPRDFNAMRSFLSTNDNLEHQSLHRSLGDLDRLSRTEDPSNSRPSSLLARHEAFDNFQDRYVSAFAENQPEANKMDEKLDLVQTALFGESEKERARAVAELQATFAASDPGLVAVVADGGLGRLDTVVDHLRKDTEKRIGEEKASHSSSLPADKVKGEVLSELTRANNQLVADLLTLEGVDNDTVMGLLQSGDPAGIDAAIAAAAGTPRLLTALQPYKAQQLLQEAQFGPDGERAGKLAELETILETNLGVPAADLTTDDAIVKTAQQLLPTHISNPILEYIDERTSGQIVMTEYSQMPMRERVAQLETITAKAERFGYVGTDGERQLLEDLREVYAGLDDQQALELATEFARYNDGDTPQSLVSDCLYNMSGETAATARMIMDGVMPVRYANAIAHARATDSSMFFWGRGDDSKFVHTLMTEQQTEEAYKVIQGYLNAEEISGTPIDWLGEGYIDRSASTPQLEQALPGTTGGAVSAPIGRVEKLNNDLDEILNGLPADISTATDNQKYEARQRLLDLFNGLPAGTRRDDTIRLMGAHPDLRDTIKKLESTVDFDPDGTGPAPLMTAVQSKEQVTELLVMTEGMTRTDLTGAAPGLGIDTNKIQTGLTATAAPAERDAALAELQKLGGGLEGPRQARALNTLIERQTGKSLTEMAQDYNTAHPGATPAERQEQADLLLAANGVDANEIALQLARTGPHAATAGAGSRLSFGGDLGRITAALPEDIQSAFGARVSEAYSAKTGHSIEEDFFPADPGQRDGAFRTVYGDKFADEVAVSTRNLEDVLSQGGQGRNVDESFLQAVEQVDRVAQGYPAGPQREAFVRELNGKFKRDNGDQSLQETMELVCSSASLKSHVDLIGLDFSKIESTPESTGAKIDTDIKAIDASLDPASIAVKVARGTYSVDDLTADKQKLIDNDPPKPELAEALPGRIAAAYRASYPGKEIDLSQIAITDSTAQKRIQVVAAFYGDNYAAQMDADMQAINNATTPEELETALRGIPDLELFAEHYQYVIETNLRADIQTKLDTAEKKTEFNNLFANEIGRIGGNF